MACPSISDGLSIREQLSGSPDGVDFVSVREFCQLTGCDEARLPALSPERASDDQPTLDPSSSVAK